MGATGYSAKEVVKFTRRNFDTFRTTATFRSHPRRTFPLHERLGDLPKLNSTVDGNEGRNEIRCPLRLYLGCLPGLTLQPKEPCLDVGILLGLQERLDRILRVARRLDQFMQDAGDDTVEKN